MNYSKSSRSATQGSALITVVFLMFMMAMLTGSILLYSGGENRANNRNRLILRARNASENIALYASEQITAKLYRQRNQNSRAFMDHVAGVHDSNEVALPPASILTTQFTNTTGMEVWAGLTSSNPVAYIDPTNPANAGNPNAGLSAATSVVQIIAQATATHPVLGSVTSYCEQDLEVATIPLFQFAVFYNMDMEFAPGADMTIAGPVHTNGNLIARNQTGRTNTVTFLQRVTTAKGFFANTAYKGVTVMNSGSVDSGPGGPGHLYFTSPSGVQTDIFNGSIWRDHFYGVAYTVPATAATIPPASSLTSFKTFATATYGNNFRTSVHGVTPLVLPGISNYKEADDPATPGDDRNNGRQVIEAPDPADTAGVADTKVSRNAGLYIIVNPTAQTRTGILPDASTVAMRAYSYRCWLNTINSDLTHTITEVILPGQPSYGTLNANVNNLPNAYRVDTAVGSNQVLRVPKGAGADLADTGYTHTVAPTYTNFEDAYFYDLRRATNSYPGTRTAANPYAPRPIAKIDLDMTRFKMAVDRTYFGNTTSTVYYPSLPSDSTTWNSFIFNSAATPTSQGLGLGDPSYNLFGAQVTLAAVQRSQAVTYAPTSITIGSTLQTGAAGPLTAYPCRFVIKESTTVPPAVYAWGPATYTSLADEASYTYTPTAGSTVTAIQVTQFLAGGTATQLDQQVIPIVTDGSATVTAALTNDNCMVPATSNTSGLLTNNASTTMKIYLGATDDTANWTYTAVLSTGSNAIVSAGGFGTGRAKNTYTVTGISTTSSVLTGTVTITAAKTGFASISKVFTLTKQSSVAAAASPTQTGRWLSITNLPGPDPFQIYFAPASPTDPLIQTSPGTFAVSQSYLYNATSPCPWRDGISIYLLSTDAEDRSLTAGVQNRADSGVRLWNGRGPATSLPSATGLTGFTLATNDPVYIIGHFNADGVINSLSTSTVNPGGYSAVYPDTANEYLTSIMGDATTIVSQPAFSSGAGGTPPYVQTTGWADSLSSHSAGSASSGSWDTSAPSGSNTVDGISTSMNVGNMPNLSVPGNGSSQSQKFSTIDTEVSACLLIGIVPTNANPAAPSSTTPATYVTSGPPSPGPNGQTSGGVHNYPRLLEVWSSGLYFRGSMVAMFESRVAMEPWGIRWYSAPSRYWGMNASLSASGGAHHVPLEPMLLNARRMRFDELTAQQYTTTRTTIQALPH